MKPHNDKNKIQHVKPHEFFLPWQDTPLVVEDENADASLSPKGDDGDDIPLGVESDMQHLHLENLDDSQ